MRNIAHIKLNLSSVLFVLVFIVFGFTISSEIGNSSSMYKYIAIFIAFFEVFIKWIRYREKGNKCIIHWKYVVAVFVIMFLFSVYKSIFAARFTFRTIQEFIFLIIPFVYSILLYKTMDRKILYKNMKIAFLICFIFYIISLGMNFKSIYRELVGSNFSESESALESSLYCGLSLGFAVFFTYFDESKLFRNMAILFVFMTFKRLFMVMIVILFVVSKLRLKDKKVTRKMFISCFLFLCIFSLLYYQCMLPENVYMIYKKYGIDLVKFSSTRANRLKWLLLAQYNSYGFGSSFEFMYNRVKATLEMDIIKIFLELGYIPAFALMYGYLKISSQRAYTFVFMLFLIMNLIFSSGLTGVVSWTIYFCTILYAQENKEIKKMEGLWKKD